MAFHDLARVTSSTTGTGTLTLGAAVSGFKTFANAGVTNGEVVEYSIRDGASSEVGRGTYTTASATLSRDVIYQSTNSNAAINCSGNEEVFIPILAETANIIDPYGLHHRISGSSSDDDEFATDTSASYTAITPTGTASWSIANHSLNVQFSGQASSDVAAFVKPLTLADGEALETSIRIATEQLKNYTMFGLLLTDGTANTSNMVTANFFMDNSAEQLLVRCDGGTITAMSGSGASYTLSSVPNGIFRVQLKRTSSTAYSWLLATENGGLFYNWGVSTYNPSFTPTHGGVFVSVFGGTHKAIASFDYLRHV